MASKPTAATLDAMRALCDLEDIVYDALKQIFSEKDVLEMMNGYGEEYPSGFNRALKDLQDETYKLTNLVTEGKLRLKKKGLI